MTEDEITAFENEGAWDLESAEPQTAAPSSRRAVVSVGFKPSEFSAVAAAARESRQPVSQYIRNAAIEKAAGQVVESRTVVLTVENLGTRSVQVMEAIESTLKAGKPRLHRRLLEAV